jgi:large subunit ribosomal protein L20
MARVKRGLARHRYVKKLLKAARGYRGGRHALYRTATETVDRARAFAFRDRRRKKREFRSLWIVRINAAARENGLRYSQLMSGISKAGIQIDRRQLAQMALEDAAGFSAVAQQARAALS